MNWIRNLGPGFLVTAAFIGPGTITTASVVGAGFGFALLWALAFSVLATIVLQEMAARLGLASRQGLGEALRTTFRSPVVRTLAALGVVAAIGIGNAAFQTGNITGAVLGIEAITGVPGYGWAAAIGLAAFALLGLGAYKPIERVLIGLVLLMSIVFLVTAIVVRPDLGRLVRGMVIPSLPAAALIPTVALIGTTVVPYNLFLHSSLVLQKWPESVPLNRALIQARRDTVLSILLGGGITLAVVVTSAAALFERGTEIKTAATMAEQLEPLLGPAARYFFATGLLAAGLSSAITAPLAAAYAISGVLGWSTDLRSFSFRAVWAAVALVGTVLAMLGKSPVQVILFAQAANGILLPLIVVFLLVVMNRSNLLREHTNGLIANVLGVAVVLTAVGLGVFQLSKVFGMTE